MSSQACERLASVEGVLRAGGVASSEIIHTSLDPRNNLLLLSASPSWLQIVWPDSPKLTGVAIGNALASRLGLVRGSTVPLVPASSSHNPSANLEIQQVLPVSPRSDRFESAAVYAASPTETVAECLVESESGAVEKVRSVLASWFSPSPVFVRPFYSLDQLQLTPQQELDSRPSKIGPYLGFALLLSLALGRWGARKQDFALYRVLGLKEPQLAVMLVIESAVTVWGPAIFGGTGATIAGLCLLRANPVAAELSLLDYASLVFLLLVVPAIGWLWLRLLPVSDSLRGRN
ncbi:hypothetical protein HNP00_002236 [Arthrobacter sp. AZCC_0090]|nr:hypothetical protein [Arthrobacter sp. AZCC_0090]